MIFVVVIVVDAVIVIAVVVVIAVITMHCSVKEKRKCNKLMKFQSYAYFQMEPARDHLGLLPTFT